MNTRNQKQHCDVVCSYRYVIGLTSSIIRFWFFFYGLLSELNVDGMDGWMDRLPDSPAIITAR